LQQVRREKSFILDAQAYFSFRIPERSTIGSLDFIADEMSVYRVVFCKRINISSGNIHFSGSGRERLFDIDIDIHSIDKPYFSLQNLSILKILIGVTK